MCESAKEVRLSVEPEAGWFLLTCVFWCAQAFWKTVLQRICRARQVCSLNQAGSRFRRCRRLWNVCWSLLDRKWARQIQKMKPGLWRLRHISEWTWGRKSCWQNTVWCWRRCTFPWKLRRQPQAWTILFFRCCPKKNLLMKNFDSPKKCFSVRQVSVCPPWPWWFLQCTWCGNRRSCSSASTFFLQ